jgi:hypothetical protein
VVNFDFDLADNFSFTVSPLESMLRGTLIRHDGAAP